MKEREAQFKLALSFSFFLSLQLIPHSHTTEKKIVTVRVRNTRPHVTLRPIHDRYRVYKLQRESFNS